MDALRKRHPGMTRLRCAACLPYALARHIPARERPDSFIIGMLDRHAGAWREQPSA